MPRSCRVEFFLDPNAVKKSRYSWHSNTQTETPKVIEWVDRLSRELSDSPSDQNIQEDLENICKLVIHKLKSWNPDPPSGYSYGVSRIPPFSDEVLARIIALSVELDKKSLFLEAYEIWSARSLATISTESSSGNLYPLMLRSIGIALLRYDLESLLPRLSSQCSAIGRIFARLEVIFALKMGLDTEAKRTSKSDAIYQDWVKLETDKALTSLDVAIEAAKDGSVLSTLAKQVPSQDIFNK